jgi:hypothetical protein
MQDFRSGHKFLILPTTKEIRYCCWTIKLCKLKTLPKIPR